MLTHCSLCFHAVCRAGLALAGETLSDGLNYVLRLTLVLPPNFPKQSVFEQLYHRGSLISRRVCGCLLARKETSTVGRRYVYKLGGYFFPPLFCNDRVVMA